MADPYNDKTYVRETRTTNTGNSGSMALIVGGLVVAVAFILWLVLGASDRPVVATDPVAPADGATNVTIDADEPAADPVAPVEDAPAESVLGQPVETAPAETGTAPATGTTAPANP